MSTFTLTQEQYEALVSLARTGAATPDQQRNLDTYLKSIEAASNIIRHSIWIQWQEQFQPLPPGTAFPAQWPPQLRYRLELLARPIARTDVMQVLQQKAKQPVNVLVTKDPGAILGWTTLDKFFLQ